MRRDGAAVVGRTRFVAHLKSTQTRIFSVAWPDEYKISQRREHLRLDTEAPVRYTVLSQNDIGGAGMEGHGVTRNLSAGGVQFVVKAAAAQALATASPAIAWLIKSRFMPP